MWGLLGRRVHTRTTTPSECHSTSQRLFLLPQCPPPQWGSSYMQKNDEKRNRSEGGRAHRQVVDILEKFMGRIFGRGQGGRNPFHSRGMWGLLGRKVHTHTTTLSECHTTSQRLSLAPQCPPPQWGSSYIQKHDEKGTGVKGGALIAKLWIFWRSSWGVFLGEG